MQVQVHKEKFICLSKNVIVSKKDGKKFFKVGLFNKVTEEITETFCDENQFNSFEKMKEYELNVKYTMKEYNAKLID